jgi:glycosyltransferase involved in cell wall biosynthesis
MRIAYLSTDPTIAYRGTRGAAVRLGELAAALARDGAEVLLVAAASVPGPPAPPHVTVEALPGPRPSASTTARLAAEPGRQAWLVNRLRSFGADALYEPLALHSSAGSAAADQMGIPHLVELSAPLLDAASAAKRLYHPADAQRMEHEVLARAAVVFAATSVLADYAVGRGASRVEILPNAAGSAPFAPRADRTGDPVAVFVSSMQAWHGIDTIIEAWQRLGDAAPRLRVVGDGPWRRELVNAGLDVERSVPHERIPSLLASADIGLAPYASGAARYLSPLKVFEYLAAGLAVVASDLPGVTDHFGADTVVPVPAGSAPALADAVSQLAGDATSRARLGAAGRDAVAAGHTWAHRARHVLDAARKLTPVATVHR